MKLYLDQKYGKKIHIGGFFSQNVGLLWAVVLVEFETLGIN